MRFFLIEILLDFFLFYLSDGLDGSSVFQQQLHDFDAVLLASDVKWGEAVLSTQNHKNTSDYPDTAGTIVLWGTACFTMYAKV